MLMGKHTRKRYRMGDRVEVKVLAANPTQRQIDLIPASMDMPDAEPEEKPAIVKPPKKLRTPLEAGIDADLVTGRRSATGAAARAGGAAQTAGTQASGKQTAGQPAGTKRTGTKPAGAKQEGGKQAGAKQEGGKQAGAKQ